MLFSTSSYAKLCRVEYVTMFPLSFFTKNVLPFPFFTIVFCSVLLFFFSFRLDSIELRFKKTNMTNIKKLRMRPPHNKLSSSLFSFSLFHNTTQHNTQINEKVHICTVQYVLHYFYYTTRLECSLSVL